MGWIYLRVGKKWSKTGIIELEQMERMAL